MADNNSKSRIGLCVICGHLPPLGWIPGVIGINQATKQPIPCKACNGNGYTHFRSDK